MMIHVVNIPILLASPQGVKGQTAEVIKDLIEEIHHAGFQTKIITTPDLSFAACGGCLACESTDECVVKDDIQTFQKSLLTSPGFILATPVYLMGPPGRLKCLLDRFWFWMLRPRLFGKYAAVVVTSVSFGAESLSEYLSAILESWGFGVVKPVAATVPTEDDVETRKKNILNNRLLGRRLLEAIEKKKRIKLSLSGKQLVKDIWRLIQDNKDRFQRSYSYWQEKNMAKQFGI
jgi:multimeric flavodoxin WrbA